MDLQQWLTKYLVAQGCQLEIKLETAVFIFILKGVKGLQKNETVLQEKPKKIKRKPQKGNTKPSGFREFEMLAKEILEGEGVSYFEWLHKQHQEIILDFNLSNKKEIANLAREDE